MNKDRPPLMDLTPTWETAVLIYAAVLENPGASLEARNVAREDLVRLARAVDSANRESPS